MLEIRNLTTSVENKKIINNLNLTINPGEVHALMGPNGAGKSTLSYALSGKKGYETSGQVKLLGQDLLKMPPEDRATAGLFLSFQYPIEIPGINNEYFLRTAVNAIRKHQQKEPLDAIDFVSLVKEKMALMQMDEKFLARDVNEGFSGGEKKRNEILQMQLLEPKLAILDETDSGLDIDALQVVANGINAMRSPERSFLVITHYQRLLNFIEPDFVHVFHNGQIVKSGTKDLALELEEKGYGWIQNV